MARREEELNGPTSGPRPTIPPTPVDWAKMSERFERDREAGLPYRERDERAQAQPAPEGDLADPRTVASDLLRGRGQVAPQPPQAPQAPQPPRPPQPPHAVAPVPPAPQAAPPVQPPAPPQSSFQAPPAQPPAAQPAPRPPAAQGGGGVGIAPEDQERFRARWPEIKATFVDDPRASVQQADQLVEELVQLLTRRIGEERARIERAWGADASTEDLRQALHSYQVLFERLS